MSRFSALFLSVSLGLPGVALAKDATLCPLIPKSADAQQVVNVSQLIWSELEFMPDYDSVALVDQSPGSLNLSCLNSASCLRGVASEVGGDDLVVGSLTTTSDTFELDLVLFDAGRGSITRRQTFTLGASPEQVADGMNAVMKELITGKAPKAAAAEEPAMADFSMDDDLSFGGDDGFGDDDFGDFDIAEDDPGEAQRRAEEDERRRQEAEAERRRQEEAERRRREAAEEERRRREAEEAERRRREEEDRRRREAEAERRRQEEAERRRREEEDRRRQEESSQQDDDLDLSMISFGSAADKVTEEEIAAEISFGSAADQVTSDSSRSSSSSRSRSNYYEDDDDFLDEEDDFSIADIEDMDDDEPRSRREKPERDKPERSERSRSSSSSRGSKASVDRDSDDRRMFTTSLRVGYSLYGSLNFITYGVEVGIPVHDVIYVMAGVEGYSVERQVPPKFQTNGQATEWNHIAPINVGAMYKNRNKAFQPYVGADLIFANYYVDSASGAGAWTVGGRLRGGFDYMLATNIGLNLNASLGYWAGDKWTLIDQNTQNGGILPQISAGTVIAF